MELVNFKVEELNTSELGEKNGGVIIEAFTIIGGLYCAGYACGQAYYYYTH